MPAWSRPRPVRKDSNVRAWLWFLALASLAVALWVPMRALYQRARYKPVEGGVRDAASFVALAYGGVSAGKVRGAEDVSREQFEQQVKALRGRGYHPIGLEDVRAFYREGRLLPRKAVLLTLEQSKKSSYLETRRVLRQNRWKAVMFVRADTIRARDPSALRWPILRDMALSGSWDVAAESADGFQRIPSGPDGQTGNFFATPRWIPEEFRLEAPREFAARIRRDHLEMLAAFQSGIGMAPLAFAFPYGDYGQYDVRATPTRVMNLAAVEEHYGLGFTLGPFLLNTRHTDPRALNRLLVDPAWSLEQFLSVLDSGWTVAPWAMERPLDRSRWRVNWGEAREAAGGSLLLKAVGKESGDARRTTGALAWLVASDLFDDVALAIRFRILAGQFGIRMRARPGGEEGLRILLDAAGNAWACQKVFGAEEFVHAAAQNLGMHPGKEQELWVGLRDRHWFVWLDDKLLFKEPLETIGEVHPGLFGLEVWDPEEGVAATQVLGLQFPKLGRVLKNLPAGGEYRTEALMQAIGTTPCTLAAISPPWLDAGKNIPLVLPKWDDETLRTFARMAEVPVLPRIALRSVAQALQLPAALPAFEARAMKVDGVQLDCSSIRQDELPALMPWVQDVHRNLEEHQMKLALHFPSSLARQASFASVAALFPGALIAVESEARARALDGALTNVVVAEDVAPSTGDMHMNLYYQVAARELALSELSPSARLDRYRREGYAAYQEGDYARALEQWTAWLELDPGSAEALSLIGRTHVQIGDLPAGVDYYRRSLDASPGQIALVIRLAELLDRMERSDESRDLLNLYARIFPENPDILIAQAQWLDRGKRRREALEMVEVLVREAPMNLSARLALLRFQDSPTERYRIMRGILELGRMPDSQLPFGHSLLNMEMLTFPESGVFFDYILQQTSASASPTQRALYESFLPLTNRVTDDFAAGRLSDGWIASGGMRPLDRGRYELRAAIDQSETYLRLRRSELMRDGFIEVMLDESQGFFWIYARRSSRAMVRFGFDQEGYMHLQAWSEGEMINHATRPWIRPPGGLKMRMEVRGDGVRGFVNGLEIFDGAVEMPPSVAYGWWGIAPFAFDLGVARARIIRMDCEPLATTFMLVPPGDPLPQVVRLRPFIGEISAIVPSWFFQNPDGSLPEELPEDASILRMFASFHGMRLLPAVDLSYEGDVDPARVVSLLRRHRLDGIVLKRRSPPRRAWLDALTAEVEKHPANVLVLQTEAALWNSPRAGEESRGELVIRPEVADVLLPRPGETVSLTELPIGSVLIAPQQAQWQVGVDPAPSADDLPAGDSVTPRLFLLTADSATPTAPADPLASAAPSTSVPADVPAEPAPAEPAEAPAAGTPTEALPAEAVPAEAASASAPAPTH